MNVYIRADLSQRAYVRAMWTTQEMHHGHRLLEKCTALLGWCGNSYYEQSHELWWIVYRILYLLPIIPGYLPVFREYGFHFTLEIFRWHSQPFYYISGTHNQRITKPRCAYFLEDTANGAHPRRDKSCRSCQPRPKARQRWHLSIQIDSSWHIRHILIDTSERHTYVNESHVTIFVLLQ